jgi:hypothetical protein
MYTYAMRSDQLTDAQIGMIAEKIRPMLRYLSKLENRILEQNFPEDDRLLVLVRAARTAFQGLHMELHYLTCDNIGRPPREGK